MPETGTATKPLLKDAVLGIMDQTTNDPTTLLTRARALEYYADAAWDMGKEGMAVRYANRAAVLRRMAGVL